VAEQFHGCLGNQGIAIRLDDTKHGPQERREDLFLSATLGSVPCWGRPNTRSDPTTATVHRRTKALPGGRSLLVSRQ